MRGVSLKLNSQVDGASVAIVRIGLGLLIAVEAAGFLSSGWLQRSFLDPQFLFTFQGFDWVRPWPGIGIYVHASALVVLGVCVAAGIAHRLAAPLLAAGFAYIFLLDKAVYLNHFYAAVLLLVLIAAVPADRALSVSARRHPRRPRTVPLWAVWILRFQVAVIYAYAGIAKLGRDWLAGEPMGMWLADRSDALLIGGLLDQPWAGLAFSWAGVAFDLAIVPLLLWRRTRAVAFCLAVAFHLTNWVIFEIGIFPPMMIVATTIFFDPDWPRRAWSWMRGAGERLRGGAVSPSPGASPGPGAARAGSGAATAGAKPTPVPRLLFLALSAYVAIQLLVPLRHHLYPGSVHWTEEGHRFAWQMKLRDKQGSAVFTAIDRGSGERRALDPTVLVSSEQLREASLRPDMILQLAHRLAERERAAGHDVEIRARARVSLNGRPAEDLIDPRRDLATVPRNLGAADWIAP